MANPAEVSISDCVSLSEGKVCRALLNIYN